MSRRARVRHLLRSAAVLAMLVVTHGFGATAQAAESYDNCTGFVDSVPATISTQGTWCLRGDVSTAMASGAAITIATNNVSLDCNHFKIGGLAAGLATRAVGIVAQGRTNVAVRNCTVRGFQKGISLAYGAGHVVEDNRLDGNTWNGITVGYADTVVIRRNLVLDTGGGSLQFGRAIAIALFGTRTMTVEDNRIGNVFSNAQCLCDVTGIEVVDSTGVMQGNHVSNLMPYADRNGRGIVLYQNPDEVLRVIVRGNALVNEVQTDYGVLVVNGNGTAICRDNTIVGHVTGLRECIDAGGNAVH